MAVEVNHLCEAHEPLVATADFSMQPQPSRLQATKLRKRE